jgi:DNA-binding NtrC family response regulator
MIKHKILIVDDEEKIRKILQRLLVDEGYETQTADNGLKALEITEVFRPDIILMDQNMPGMNGIDAMEQIKQNNSDIIIIIITAFGKISSAVDAIKRGAYDYLEKPFDNDKLLLLIKRAIGHLNMQQEITSLKSQLGTKRSFDSIVAESPLMKKVIEQARCVAETDTSVLIQGESGVGKELIAQAIHNASKRNNKPLIAINCGAIPSTLIESELFGHEKGAFTDAREAKQGKFEQASGGTLFLDELGELPLDAQVKLLRVLEEKKITRIGGSKAIPVDVRIISATNNNLEERIQKGTFRLDLYYRLNIFNVTIPSLRDRKEDIPFLIERFIERYNTEMQTQVESISQEAIECLCNYSWPGNVRDLQNALQSAIIVCRKGTLKVEHLPMRLKGYVSAETNIDYLPMGEQLKTISARVEKDMIVNALQKCQYNRTEAAKLLNMSRKTLFNKMKALGL